MPKFKLVVYKITFPNGKIYVGQDHSIIGHSMRYFGSWNNDLVEADFSKEQLASFTLTKDILFESDDLKEIYRMESEFIRQLSSNDPQKGYNQTHRKRRV